MVLVNGKIVTVDAAMPQAEAIAVRGDRIVAVGSTQEIEALVGDATRVVELGGRLVTPGFIEGHGHYTSLGQSKMILDLTQATIWDEIVAMVDGAIVERGTHNELLDNDNVYAAQWSIQTGELSVAEV